MMIISLTGETDRHETLPGLPRTDQKQLGVLIDFLILNLDYTESSNLFYEQLYLTCEGVSSNGTLLGEVLAAGQLCSGSSLPRQEISGILRLIDHYKVKACCTPFHVEV